MPSRSANGSTDFISPGIQQPLHIERGALAPFAPAKLCDRRLLQTARPAQARRLRDEPKYHLPALPWIQRDQAAQVSSARPGKRSG